MSYGPGQRFCHNCGAPLQGDESFCGRCGAQTLDSGSQAYVAGAAASASGYAGFWKRFAAYLIDSLVVGVGMFAVFLVFGIGAVASGVDETSFEEGNAAFTAFIYIVAFLGSWLYFALFESSSKQATPGKMALSIKVTDEDGGRIGFWRASGRYWGKLISTLILYIGFLMAGWTKRKQALHDMLASTLVVNR